MHIVVGPRYTADYELIQKHRLASYCPLAVMCCCDEDNHADDVGNSDVRLAGELGGPAKLHSS